MITFDSGKWLQHVAVGRHGWDSCGSLIFSVLCWSMLVLVLLHLFITLPCDVLLHWKLNHMELNSLPRNTGHASVWHFQVRLHGNKKHEFLYKSASHDWGFKLRLLKCERSHVPPLQACRKNSFGFPLSWGQFVAWNKSNISQCFIGFDWASKTSPGANVSRVIRVYYKKYPPNIKFR